MIIRALIWLPRAIARHLTRARGTPWTVGVVRYGGSGWRLRGDVVVWKEQVPIGSDETARVAALAAQVREGTLDVRTRLATKRRI